MGITLDRGRYYLVKNVPNYLFGKVLGSQGQAVRQKRWALRTADLSVAKRKAFEIEEITNAEWHLLSLGEDRAAYTKYEVAKRVAESHGFDYVPVDVLLKHSFRENLPRLRAAVGVDEANVSPEVTDALLGAMPVSLPPLRVALEEYVELTKTKHMRKTDRQRRNWRLPRDRAVSNFETAVPNRAASGLDKITRDDALKFRNWWAKRVETGETRAETANKDFGHLSQLYREWCELKGHTELDNPFAKLRFDKSVDPKVMRPPFSRHRVECKLLANEALEGLNEEAADALLMMVNTGLRPSEILSCPLDDFCVAAEIPFIRVSANGRELKQKHTERDVPLMGVSLAAAERIVASGGIQRYLHNANSWSSLVNKYLENNGLKETPEHAAFSLRHYVEDALLTAGVDDRVRADIMGHKYARPIYGSGGGLGLRREALERIAL